MGVHATGTGTGWDEASPDIDQPHGLDYREEQDIRKGVRKRIAKEHLTFADATVGGEHIPGGCNVLHTQDASATPADISDKSGDATGYHEGGLVCLTGRDGTSPALWYFDDNTEPIPIMMTPGSCCLGADWTWDGAHLFDASCDFSDVAVTGDLTLEGKFIVDSSADFSDVYVDGDITIKGTLKVATDFSLTGDMAVDGTSNFYDECDFSDMYLRGDITGSSLKTTSIFGTDSTRDSAGAGFANEKTYLINGDGFWCIGPPSDKLMTIKKADVTNTVDIIGRSSQTGPWNTAQWIVCKKGWYVSICCDTGIWIARWLPIGAPTRPTLV
jgi:hypothetical protein